MRFSFETADTMFNTIVAKTSRSTPLQRSNVAVNRDFNITQDHSVSMPFPSPRCYRGLPQYLKLPNWFSTTILLEYSHSSHSSNIFRAHNISELILCIAFNHRHDQSFFYPIPFHVAFLPYFFVGSWSRCPCRPLGKFMFVVPS